MSTINLEFTTTTSPDFGAFNFYVLAGHEFDARTYADAYSIDYYSLNAQDVNAAQNAAARLNTGEWLHVTHSIFVETEHHISCCYITLHDVLFNCTRNIAHQPTKEIPMAKAKGKGKPKPKPGC